MTIDSNEYDNSRMVVNKMVLKNFKSYAGTQEIGPFHQSLSAVVGPNGSGKSNVIDALLFVFGYRATKMRQPKASDLVHFSEAHPNIEFCSVQIHFHYIKEENGTSEPSNVQIIPGSQFFVERIAYKNPSRGTDYVMNHKTASWKEVTAFLKSKGIDLDHNRFLILQGEVESISLMKPKAPNENEDGLLEYLEDIIGSNIYKPLIQTAFEKLENISKEVNIKSIQLKAVEKEMNSKEALKIEAEAYLKEENEISLKKYFYHQVVKHENEKECTAIQSEQKALEEQLLSISANIKDQSEKLLELQKLGDKASEEIIAIKSKLTQENSKLKELESSHIRIQENCKHIKTKLQKSLKSSAAEKATLSEKSATFEALKVELENKNQQLELLENNLIPAENELNKLRDSLKEKTDKYKSKIAELRSQLGPYSDKMSEIQAKINRSVSELSSMKDEVSLEETSKSSLMEGFNHLKASYEALMSKLTEEEKKSSDSQREIATLLESKTSLIGLSKTQESAILALKVQATDLKDSIVNASSGDKILNALMNESNISGVFGKLRDLGTIDEKYAVALQASTGALDHIVVDTTVTGEKCIEFLRQKQFGRSTFIVLEKVATTMNFEANNPCSNKSQRLIDLITPLEEQFFPAFCYAVRDTLVANTLEDANLIAFGSTEALGAKFRVVTLDGKLIDKNGAMTGGGSTSTLPDNTRRAGNKGLMRSKGHTLLKKELDEAEKELKAQINKLEETMALIAECNSTIEFLKFGMNHSEGNILKVKKEIEMVKIKTSSIEKSLSERNSKKEPLSYVKRMKELETLIEKLEKDKIELERKMEPLKTKISVEEEKILEAGGIEFRSQLSHVDGVKEQIETIETRLSKIKHEMKTTEKAIHRLEIDLKKYESETALLEGEIKALDSESKEHTIAITKSQKEKERLDNLLQDRMDETTSFRTELSSAQHALNDLKNQQLDIQNQLTMIHDKLKRASYSINHAIAELNKIQLHTIDEQAPALLQYKEELLSQYHKKADKLQKEILVMQEKLSNRKPHLASIEEYTNLKVAYQKKEEEASTIAASRDEVKNEYEKLKKTRLDEFMKGFQTISLKLKELYQMITLGGNAELELIDSFDPFSEGVSLSVMPPRKSWKNIADLSGGEKTLTSLALIFALHHYKPTPIYVMDEIDAALDFKNVSIVANYIKERTKNNAQFIVISLRSNMFELADHLIGIYKVNQCSRSILLSCSLDIIKMIENQTKSNEIS